MEWSGRVSVTYTETPGTGIVQAVEHTPHIDVGRWAETLVFAAQLADKVANTEFVPAALRGRPEAVAATIMYGAEVGVTPMQALAGIHIVDGRPAPSAELMRAMIQRAGHSLVVHEMTGTRCRVSGLRRGRPETERVTVEWTLDMARSAGLLGRKNWQNYPRAMLTARATGDLARLVFADVVKGLGYVSEDDTDDATWGPVPPMDEPPVAPARAPIQRRSRPISPPVVEDLDTPPEPPDNAGNGTDERDGGADVPPRTAPPPPTDQASGLPGRGGRRPSDPPPPADEPHDRYQPDDVPLPEENQLHPPRLIGAGMLKALHTGLGKELGSVATSEEKRALVAAIIGHEIASSKNLTTTEALRVMAYLERFNDGTASWAWNTETGGIDVMDLRQEPDDEGNGT